MVETNYAMEDGDRQEAIETICSLTDNFVDYTNIVASEQHQITMARIRYSDDLESLHDTIERIDRQRRNTHNCAINAVNMLNRILPNELDIPEGFVQIDTSNRQTVADFAATFTTQQDSQTTEISTMDEYMTGEKETPTNKTRKRLNELLDRYEQLLQPNQEPAPENELF